jgi:hypothetical protein
MTIFLQSDSSGPANSSLTDLGIGGAGAETVLIPDMMSATVIIGSAGIFSPLMINTIPLVVPAGTRIAARGQSQVGSLASYVSVIGFSGGFPNVPPVGRVATLGVNTGTTRGIGLTAAGTANVKGSYVELTASLAFDARYLITMAARQATNFCVDVAAGGAGSETVILPDIIANPYMQTICVWPVAIPAGTRLAARCSATVGGAQMDYAVIAVG